MKFSNPINSRIKINIVGSFITKFFSIIVQLMLVPITLDYLSEDLYGVWLTVTSFIMALNFFDIGFSLGLKNRLAEAIANQDYDRGKGLVSTTYGILMIIFIPLGIILECFLPMIDWSALLNIECEYQEIVANLIRILIISFVLQMIFNTIQAILSAFQYVALAGSFYVIGNVLSLGMIWILTKTTEPSLINMGLTVSFIPVVVYIISSIILYNGRLKAIKPSLKYFRSYYIKDLFSLGISFFIIQLNVVILQQITNLLISHVSSPDYVTYYNIAYRYIGTASMLILLIVNPIWPAFTEAFVKQNYQWMKHVYNKLIKICLVFIALAWLMCLLSDFIYKLWLGSDVHIPSMMTVLVTCYITGTLWLSINVYPINGIGKVKLQSYIVLIGIFLQIPLALLLGNYIGAYGVIASMIGIIFILCLFMTIQIRKILNQNAVGIWSK